MSRRGSRVMEDLTIFVATWNVSAKPPLDSEPLHHLLGLIPNSTAYVTVPDLYVVGLQEVKSQPQNILYNAVFDDPWTEAVKSILATVGLVKVQTVRLQGLQTSVFIKRTHLTFLRDIETLSTRRGLGGMWGNKGAISYRFSIYGCSLVFVNSHLTPHDAQISARIEDYQQILNQEFSIRQTSNILFHDYVFWFGDLNFRLGGDKSSEQIISLISHSSLKSLLNDDQLSQVRSTGEAFSELMELPVTFQPTYKFETGYDSYDSKRRPGWTDRILYAVNANAYDNVTLRADVSEYKSHMRYRLSDHRPVSANFKIKVFRSTAEKMVEFDTPLAWHVGQANKIFYRVCPTLETSSADWIAIYRSDLTSLDDYVAYTYVQPVRTCVSPSFEPVEVRRAVMQERSVVFSDSSVLLPGTYVLVYFSHEPRSVYGMSKDFLAQQELPTP